MTLFPYTTLFRSGLDVECVISPTNNSPESPESQEIDKPVIETAIELALLISPFFFWGTAMVAMKEVLPKAGPFFVAAFRLIPAGFSLVGFAAYRGASLPSGVMAWVAISAFALVDGSCFQVDFIVYTIVLLWLFVIVFDGFCFVWTGLSC